MNNSGKVTLYLFEYCHMLQAWVTILLPWIKMWARNINFISCRGIMSYQICNTPCKSLGTRKPSHGFLLTFCKVIHGFFEFTVWLEMTISLSRTSDIWLHLVVWRISTEEGQHIQKLHAVTMTKINEIIELKLIKSISRHSFWYCHKPDSMDRRGLPGTRYRRVVAL